MNLKSLNFKPNKTFKIFITRVISNVLFQIHSTNEIHQHKLKHSNENKSVQEHELVSFICKQEYCHNLSNSSIVDSSLSLVGTS